MRLETVRVGRHDFHPADLVHLVLLHLYYPVVFGKIFAEETSGRYGFVSVDLKKKLDNSNDLKEFISDIGDDVGRFLVEQLFDIKALGLTAENVSGDDGVKCTRACFNEGEYRNLERYLRLIVELKTPKDISDFKKYRNALGDFKLGMTIEDVLRQEFFIGKNAEAVHEQFWLLLGQHVNDLNRKCAEDAIAGLVSRLRCYSEVTVRDGSSVRKRLVRSLAALVCGVGANDTGGSNREAEIVSRLLDGNAFASTPLICQLLDGKEVMGWNDLVRFLDCISGSGGTRRSIGAESVSHLQREVFARFKSCYIERRVSFFASVNAIGDSDLLGRVGCDEYFDSKLPSNSERSLILSKLKDDVVCFVRGGADFGVVGRYLIDVCFNPEVDLRYAREFGDFCFRRMGVPPFFGFSADVGYIKKSIVDWFDVNELKNFWCKNGGEINNCLKEVRETVWIADGRGFNYEGNWPRVREALDQLLKEDVAPADHEGA